VALLAQDDTIDEIVVVGSQIRGAQISEVLPVSVLSEQDIEALGVNSGDELLPSALRRPRMGNPFDDYRQRLG
jgi:hypothetical protein